MLLRLQRAGINAARMAEHETARQFSERQISRFAARLMRARMTSGGLHVPGAVLAGLALGLPPGWIWLALAALVPAGAATALETRCLWRLAEDYALRAQESELYPAPIARRI
jgi:hypothetical protein